MTAKKSSTWKKGSSGNPNGRPVGTAKPISNLRKTINELRKLEPKAIENISAVVNGVTSTREDGEEMEVDKLQLETSKWVIATISSMSRAATADEALKHDIRSDQKAKDDYEEEKREGTTGNVVKFSTKMKPLPEEEEED